MSALPVENARALQSLSGVLLAAGMLSAIRNRPAPFVDLSARHPELLNASTATVALATTRAQGDWKAELRSRYETMPQTAWFREAHENKSVGDPVHVA